MTIHTHTLTPYTIEADTDPITITGRDGREVIACCGSNKIPSNHRNAAFIVRACNAWDDPNALRARLAELKVPNLKAHEPVVTSLL